MNWSLFSSGMALGACNWVIETDTHKIVYLAASSSITSRHPLPISLDPLRGADVLFSLTLFSFFFFLILILLLNVLRFFHSTSNGNEPKGDDRWRRATNNDADGRR